MWSLTTLRTALNKNCNVECVGEMSSHCRPNLPPTVSSFAWWIICKSSTLRILVSCSSKVPLRLLDLSIFAILEIQNQKNYCSKIHLGFENCTHKKRTGEKRPKQLLIVRLADKREEEIRGCGAAFRKRREGVQKIRVSMIMSSSNKVELLTAHVAAQIRHNRAPLGHCWQNIRHGPADYWGVLRLSAPLINTLSHVLSPHSHDLIPIHTQNTPFLAQFSTDFPLVCSQTSASLSPPSTIKSFPQKQLDKWDKSEPMRRVPRQSSLMLPSLYALFAKQAFSHARLTSPSVSPGQVPYLHLEASCRETRSRVSPCLGHPWFSRAGMRAK